MVARSTPSTSTWPLRRLLEAAGDRQERALAGAARAHDGHELAALDREVDLAERVHLASGRSRRPSIPGAVRVRSSLRDLHRASWFERRVGRRGRREGRPLLQADVGGVEPADDRFEPEELGVGDERQRHVVLSRPPP